MSFSHGRKQHREVAILDGWSAAGSAVVPILRAGVLARQFCHTVAFANVEAVFERCFYVRSGDDFVCIGEPAIGNGPITLIGHFGATRSLKLTVGQVASICSRDIVVGNSVQLALSHSELWQPADWPRCPSAQRLVDICAIMASRAAIDAPQEGLARCVTGGSETSGHISPMARIARPCITIFERWVSDVLDDRDSLGGTSREAVQGLIGLGPGLTPSGDDFLAGALAALDALGERNAHGAMARAIGDALPGLTTPLSACFLRAAAARHFGERFHRTVSSVIIGDVDAAIAIASEIGHSSGWDVIAGILTTLRIAARHRMSAAHAASSS